MYRLDEDYYVEKFNGFDEENKFTVIAELLNDMIEHIYNEDWVFEFTSLGVNIRVDGMHPVNPSIYMCLHNDALIGIVLSGDDNPYTFGLGMFKGSTDLDEISGCTLPIELRPWMERFLDDCMNSK